MAAVSSSFCFVCMHACMHACAVQAKKEGFTQHARCYIICNEQSSVLHHWSNLVPKENLHLQGIFTMPDAGTPMGPVVSMWLHPIMQPLPVNQVCTVSLLVCPGGHITQN